MSSVMHQYVAMLREEAGASVEAVKEEVGKVEVDASLDASGAGVKQEEVSDDISEMQFKFGVENEKFSDSDLALIKGSTNTRTYGCPITKPWAAETLQSRKLRMYADRLIRQSLVHHPQWSSTLVFRLETSLKFSDLAGVLHWALPPRLPSRSASCCSP